MGQWLQSHECEEIYPVYEKKQEHRIKVKMFNNLIRNIRTDIRTPNHSCRVRWSVRNCTE